MNDRSGLTTIFRSSSGKAFTRFLQKYNSSVFSFSALVVSLLGFYMSQRTLNTTALENEYTVYKAFAQLQHDNPLFTYLFSPSPEDYYYTVETSEKLMRGKTSDELKILALQERSLVNYIYTAYEQTYYKWQDTGYFYFINLGFEESLKSNLKYLNSLLCYNGRLLWYWNSGTYHFDHQLGKEAVAYHDKMVNPVKCTTPPDPDGPFPKSSS